ncbi:hypothetical protein AWB64_05319 [Caballeronia sordidicola]|uniref:Uncharacterized protein n=1 Tax=Caballeronia sordidicola TaxID=196367 RepID=A0A158I1K1_CABSO|nr:hypothetical protein AWB64_05319 [Caballeronia sordidicola]
MSYSCSDFTDDVLNKLTGLGLIRPEDVDENDPESQANLVIAAITEVAGKAACTAAAGSAQLFFEELLASVETLGAIAEQHDPAVLAQLMYLQSAIAKGTHIELYPAEAAVLGFVRLLPSGERWWKRVHVLD